MNHFLPRGGITQVMPMQKRENETEIGKPELLLVPVGRLTNPLQRRVRLGRGFLRKIAVQLDPGILPGNGVPDPAAT